MSIPALLSGVEQRLRSAPVLNDNPSVAVGSVCGVQPDGRPPPNAGQMYFAVYFAGLRSTDDNAQGIDWYYNVTVAITARMGYSPRDRRGAQMVTAQQLLDRAVFVATALHQDDLTRINANTLIPNTAEWVAVNGGSVTENGFLEPLRCASIGKVTPAPPDWTGATEKTDVYYVEVAMKEARRTQYLGG